MIKSMIIAHCLLAFFLISMLAGIIYIGMDGIQNDIGYWRLTLRFIVMLYVMKIFDIVVQDHPVSVFEHADSRDLYAIPIIRRKNENAV